MKETRVLMNMPIEIEVVGTDVVSVIDAAFSYFAEVEERFSFFKESSETSKINRGELKIQNASLEMQEIFALAEKTKNETMGYFNIQRPDGSLNPSGIVKGWAIRNAAKRIQDAGYENYMVNAGGDIAVGGKNTEGKEWSVGIRNPFTIQEIVKVVYPHGKGVATSGSYIRGAHIYDPHVPETNLEEVVSITVIGPDVLEADRFATAAFAMGREGINFLEQLPGFEGYAIDVKGIATMTSGFGVFTKA